MLEYFPNLKAFVKLGTFLREFCEKSNSLDTMWQKKLSGTLALAEQQNAWFTQENTVYALKHWSNILTQEQLEEWLAPYGFSEPNPPKTIGIIMAGNIPLVGFHDFLSVLLSGHNVLAKLSSSDKVLLPVLAQFLMEQDASLEDRIRFTSDKLEGFDAVIATGSNNTSRYFDYYFGKYPNIIRKNRNSIAVLTGNESEEELVGLGEDIFRYFGLGCRSVSKIYIPNNYNFDGFFNSIFYWKTLLEHHKYTNNYDYNKAVYLMSGVKMLDNNFVLLKEDNTFGSPIGTVFFEYYDDIETLRTQLENQSEFIQCKVSSGFSYDEVPFGASQMPKLNDYADGVDLVDFLLKLS